MAQQQHIPPIIVPSYYRNRQPILEGNPASSRHPRPTSHNSSTSTYALTVRQQPEKARLCSFKDKVDRRPLDPPPIIQLHRSDNTNFNDYHISANFFLHATLANVNDDSDIHYVNGNRTTAGSVVQSLHKLKDTSNSEGAFFIFSDISVRIEGVFRLKFTLFQINGLEVERICCTFSEPFRVYSPKNFPGMSESTELTRSFSDQGVRIRIRKETRVATATAPAVTAPTIKRRRRASETHDSQQQRAVRQHMSYSPPSMVTSQRTYYPYSTCAKYSSTVPVCSKDREDRTTATNTHRVMSMNNLLASSPTQISSPRQLFSSGMQTPPLSVSAKPSQSLSNSYTRHRSFSPPTSQQQQMLSAELPDVLEPSISLTFSKPHIYPFPLASTDSVAEDSFKYNTSSKLIQLPALKTISSIPKQPAHNVGDSAMASNQSFISPFPPLPTNASLQAPQSFLPEINANSLSKMRREHTS